MIRTLLEKLIVRKYYADKAIIENKLNVFYAMNKISDEDFAELTLKVEDVYAEEVVEEATEEVPTEPTEENTVTEEAAE